jgi:diadenosine tetraphosphatase ApaH/serine/threonine PP2A family protein phosphatase
VGHVHVPLVFEEGQQTGGVPSVRTVVPTEQEPLVLGERRLIINPGSVGQPRDGSPDAAYMLYDSVGGSLQLRRVSYDVRAVQQKIIAAGLPGRVATRLAYGM